MHHAERVLHRHRLRAAGLAIDVGTTEAGQDQRLPAGDQMAAVELGADLHGQRAALQRLVGARGIRGGLGEVATQADEHLHLAGEHGVDCRHRVVPRRARHGEGEALLQRIEQCRRRLLVDAHGAVALHVAVAAHRTGAGARLADVAAQ
ncbi:hypothetical protein D3C81_1414430 [compost metagenome]